MRVATVRRPDPTTQTTLPPADGPEGSGSTLRRLAPRFAAGLVLAILVVSGLALFGDARQLGTALREFDWWLAVLVLGLTLFNYALRFYKWEIYLRRLAIPRLPLLTSALIFLAGFSMSLTPGKVGELIKGVLVRRLTGTPVSRTTAIVAAERVTDGLAMLALAGLGVAQFAYGRTLLAIAFVAALAVVLLLGRPRLLTAVLVRLDGLPLVGKVLEHAVAFLEASHALYQPRLLAGMIGIGVVSWAGECLAFFLVLRGLGVDGGWHLLLVAMFVLTVSSVFGALSMLPGGLGVAEASVTGMLLLLVEDGSMTRSVAVAATLLIRFATLWFAVILGVAALGLLQRRVARGTAMKERHAPGGFESVDSFDGKVGKAT